MSVASFNPIFGQDMSMAVLDTLQFHHALAEGNNDQLDPTYYVRAANVVDEVWDITVGGDFTFPQTEGDKPRGTDLFNRYVQRLVRAAHTDGRLRDDYYRVVRLEKPATSLLRPSVLLRATTPSGGARSSF